MKRNFRNSALAIIALAATLFTVPAQAQSWGQGNGAWRAGEQQPRASWDRDRGGHDRGYRDSDRRFDSRRFDDRRFDDPRGYGYSEGYVVNEPYVAPALPPVSYGGYYAEPGYGYGRTHYGRDAAIIGGGAVAGALIGGAAGHGQGAVIGAVIGGVAGAIANSAVHNHDHRR